MKPAPAWAWKVTPPQRPRADSLFPQIVEFQELSRRVHLSEEEEVALLQLQPEEWSRWREFGIAKSDPAPELLTRRLAYAIPLLREMLRGHH